MLSLSWIKIKIKLKNTHYCQYEKFNNISVFIELKKLHSKIKKDNSAYKDYVYSKENDIKTLLINFGYLEIVKRVCLVLVII